MMKFFIGLFLYPALIFAAIPGIEVKEILEKQLQTTYLQSLEKKWGDCGSSPESCITNRGDYKVLNLPKKEICFPYTICGFYNCMEEKYKCDEVGVNYFTDLAFPTCSSYVKHIEDKKFTKQGVEWIFNVMVCLQKGLVDECEMKGNCPIDGTQNTQKKTCDHITDFTLAYHPGCYINSGVGVCKLPLKDKASIWQTVSPYLTKREREEAYKVIFQCFNPIKN